MHNENLLRKRAQRNAYAQSGREKLINSYVKKLLMAGTSMRAADVSMGLVELKRAALMLKREIRERNKA